MLWQNAAAGVLCALVLIGCGDGRDAGGWLGPSDYGVTNTGDIQRESLEFVSSDNKRLTGYMTYGPDSGPGSPGVVLVHQYLRDASQWGNLPETLARAGFRTLAFNLRGHGGSDAYDGDIGDIFADPNGAPLDVYAAIQFLLGYGEADDTRMAVVGTSIGGSLAVAASIRGWATTYVALSPTLQSSLYLADVEILTNLESVFYLSADDDGGVHEECEAMYNSTSDPREIHTYMGDEHGLSIIDQPDARDRVIAWLETQLQ